MTPDILQMFHILDGTPAYRGVYDWSLVGLSVLIAVLATFVALSIANRMAVTATPRGRAAWATAGALSLGGGIWSMHFIGMLAFSLPCGVRYQPVLTLLSMIPGILASGAALSIISRPSPGARRLGIGALLMGSGIGAMHYCGMAAMQPDALMRFDPLLVGVSVLVAVTLSFTALGIRFGLRALNFSDRLKGLVAATVMGCAISGMHYTAMQAAVFYPISGSGGIAASMPQATLALIVAGFGFLVALSTLTAAFAGEQREIANRLGHEASRRQALEQDAKRSAARLQAILDAVVDAIITMDAKGRIHQWSSGAERIFGYSVEEAVGRNITMLMPAAYRPRHAKEVAAFFRGRDVERTGRELTALHRDGREFPIELAISAVEAQGAPLFTAILRDITERKRAEEELIQARIQAEQANEAKSHFLATMSHEIRTPMNGVLGMAGLLSATPLSDQQGRLVANLTRSGQALLGIINDILDFSKIEAGKLALEPADFDPRELLAEVADLFAEPCSAKGLELIYFIAEETPRRVRGDAVRLRQVLVNLVGNAIKFTERGEVLIKLTPAKVTRRHAVLAFSVEDTGIGIEAENLERVFQSFEQVDHSMRRARGGSGLGLAISRQLVEMMGGGIAAESEFGRGSRFAFTVRCQLIEARTEARAGRKIERALKVLLVDSNLASAGVMTEYLTRWDLEVAVCHALEAAARMIEHDRFDAVLLDVKGMGAQAVEFGARLAAGHPAPAVIFLAGMDRSVVDGSLEAAGGFAMLSKPVRPSDLFECLTAVALQPDNHGLGRFFLKRAAPAALGRFRARLLVAEDNPVNQDVASGILEAMGCEVVIAPTGRIAARLFEEESFDMVLMDCEMPDMDGLEAARRIRALEKTKDRQGDRRRTPIVALTAHALADVQRACIEAGMDDFLTKPFDERRINDAMRRWIPDHEIAVQAPTDAEDPPSPAEDHPAIDRSAFEAIAAFRGPKGLTLLKGVVGKFQTNGPTLIGTARGAAEDGDAEALWRAAHSLKSSAAALGAIRLSRRCAEIEALGRVGDLQALRPLLDGLEQDLAEALAGLAEVVEEPDVRVA